MSKDKMKPMEDLLGPTLLTKVGGSEVPTSTVLKDAKLVGLYFSASWCPPCKAFTPVLASFYNKCAKSGKMQIVFVSSDKDMPSFNEYFGKMPWVSMPTQSAETKQRLADKMKIKGIPTFLILDAETGNFITDNAKNEVMQVGEDEAKGKELIASWKSKEAVPLELAKFGEGQPGGLMKILSFFLKNPAFIFGTIYIIKQILKKLNELGEEEEEL